jgi:CheY-like chemotaxis protein
VIDTGVGMDDATRARLFEPFFTTKQVGKGTGLGLASVYGTVKQLDGFITVQTQLGKGSRFDVFLPEWDAAWAQAVARPSESVKGSGRVMVVDDEESIRETAAEGLTTLGYEPVCFSDPIEAIEYYRANHGEIAIVLLDLMMPNMSGLDCFRALKNIAPAVRAVIVSGYSEDGEAGRIMEEGARIFVEKPFKIEELSRAVARAMGKEP